MQPFRAGFLLHHRGEPIVETETVRRVRRHWSRTERQEFLIWTHPRCTLTLVERAEGAIAVMGDAYVQDGRTLDAALFALDWADPWPGLDAICGRYAIAFLEGGQIRAAHDAFGSRTVFHSPGRLAIASHSALLATAVGAAEDPSVVAFIGSVEYQARKVQYLPGDLSVYAGVYALIPNTYWDGTRTRRYWPRSAQRETRKEQFLSEAERYLVAFRDFALSRGKPVFGVTGGIDSRSIFSAFGGSFEGVTWTANIKYRERAVVDEVVRHLGVPHRYLSHRRLMPRSAARAGLRGVGGWRKPSLTSEAMGAVFDGEKYIFVRGYGGEIIRGFGPYDRLTGMVEPERLTRAYGSSSNLEGPASAAYHAFCDKAFAGFIERSELEATRTFGHRLADHFYWEHRMGMWGASMLNELDPVMLSYVGLNSRPLFVAAWGLSSEARFTKDLLRDVTALFDEPLATIPYF
jgi:hypothetical protein